MRALALLTLMACGEKAAAPAVVPVASAAAAPIQSSDIVTPAPEPVAHRHSYEEAVQLFTGLPTMKGGRRDDLSDAELSLPLRDLSSLQRCEMPSGMRTTVRIAMMHGRAVGVTVSTRPAVDPAVSACIEDWVWSLTWPSRRKVDTFTTQF